MARPKRKSKAPASAGQTLRRAARAFADDHPKDTLRLCKPLIGRKLALEDQAALAALLEHLTHSAAPAELAKAEDMLAGTDDDAAAARALVLLGQPARALPKLTTALARDPTDMNSAMLLVRLHLEAKSPDEVVKALTPVTEAHPAPGRLLLNAAKALGQAGHRVQATELLNRAQYNSASIEVEIEAVRAGLEGGALTRQDTLATQIFDAFAESYDENLARIDNNGPAMVARILKEVKPPTGAVLDAGCGTGLCAPILRPFADQLTGCDISVPMLEKAKAKGTYDALARTDLSVPVTYPEGPFDLVVAADVMTYFGDLTPVLQGFAKILRPGGWVIFTVEEAQDGPDHALGPSGRYRHRWDGLKGMMTSAGLSAPRQVLRDRLRTEFGQPVPGLAVAAQKLALFG